MVNLIFWFDNFKVWFQNRRAKCRKHESQGQSKNDAAILSFDPIGRSIGTHRVFGDRPGVGIGSSGQHSSLLHHVMTDNTHCRLSSSTNSNNHSGNRSVPSPSSAVVISPTTSSSHHPHHAMTSTKPTFMSASSPSSAGLPIPSLPLHPFPRLMDPTALLAAQQVNELDN